MLKKIISFIYILLYCIMYSYAVNAPSSPLVEGVDQPGFGANINGIEISDPEFSWTADPAETQSKFQIIMSDNYSDVDTDKNGVLWSTTVITSNEYVSYFGTYTLIPNTRYYWAVRTWDAINDTSTYCTTKAFETNFFVNKQVFNPYDGADNSAYAVGDINGDGLRDFLQANCSSNTVTAYTNNGDDTFSKVWQSIQENHSQSILLVDIDSDSDLDLIVLNLQDDPIHVNSDTRIYKNDGSGTFTKIADDLTSLTETIAMASGDIDRDGDIDLIAATKYNDNYYFVNNGLGTFSPKTITFSDNITFDVVLADLNKDSYLDVIFANNNEVNRVYLNNGSGDFNNDGTNYISDWDDSDAGISAARSTSLCLIDLNSDGHWDFIAGNNYSPEQADQYYLNDGNGSFSDAGVEAGSGSTLDLTDTLSAADIDNDGDMDFVAGNSDYYDRIYLNEGSVPFTLEYNLFYNHDAKKLVLNDLNGDGNTELLRIRRPGTSGLMYSYYMTSNPSNSNQPPAAITSYSANYSTATLKLKLQWSAPTDDHSAANQLAYNVRLGTAPGHYNIMSGALATTDNSGSFYGNIGRSTYVVFSSGLPPKTYFWQVQAIDGATSTGTWSTESMINTEPVLGWEQDNILISTCVLQWDYTKLFDGNDLVENKLGMTDILFKAKDKENNPITLSDFEYSTMTAGSWTSIDTSSASLTQIGNSTTTLLWPNNQSSHFDTVFITHTFSMASAQTFIWDTNYTGNLLQDTESSQVRIRFKAYDLYNATSAYVTSDYFTIDNLAPSQPGIISTEAFTSNQCTINFGTASADTNFMEYRIYIDTESDVSLTKYQSIWSYSNDINLSSATFNGKSSTTITGLSPDTEYYFKIYAFDNFGNYSTTSTFNSKTNDPPVLEIKIADPPVQRTDGSNLIDIPFYGIDNDIEYSTLFFSSCTYGTIIPTPFIMTPSTSDISFSNSGYAIIFSTNENSYNFVWNAGLDISSATVANTRVQLAVYDGKDISLSNYSEPFTVDTLPPNTGSVWGTGATASSIDWTWNATTNESGSFDRYELWLSSVSGEAVVNKDTTTADFWTISNMLTNSTTTAGLNPFTEYWACIWAYDDFGHLTPSSTNTFTTGYTPVVVWTDGNNEPTINKDNSGKFGFTVDVRDLDASTLKLKILYSTDTAAQTWTDAYITDTQVSYGAALTDNAQTDQIYDIDIELSTTTTTVQFNWESKSDAQNIYSTNTIIQITVSDETTEDIPIVSSYFTMDNSQPIYDNTDSWALSQYIHEGSSFTIHMRSEHSSDPTQLSTFNVINLDYFEIYDDITSPTTYFTLTASTVSAQNDYIKIIIDDIARNKIARWDQESKVPYLTILSSAVTDTYGNYSEEHASITFLEDPRIAPGSKIWWQQDTSSPIVNSATYKIDAGLIIFELGFNEYVNVNSMDISALSIQSSSNIAISPVYIDATSTITQRTSDITDSKIISIELGTNDHDNIWRLRNEDNLIFLALSSATTAITDLSGNPVETIYSTNAFTIIPQLSTTSPNIIGVTPANGSYNVSRDTRIVIGFDIPLWAAQAANAVTVTQTEDSEGNTTQYSITCSTAYDPITKQIILQPYELLPGNSTILVYVQSNAIESFSGALLQEDYTWSFRTTLDNNDSNTITSPSQRITLNIAENQFVSSGKVVFTEEIPPKTPIVTEEAVLSKATSNETTWEDPYHYPIETLTAEIIFLNDEGLAIPTAFSERAQITINYSDAIYADNSEYIYSGINAPVKINTLKIYYLNETAGMWIPINTVLDIDAQTLSTSIEHFSIYTVMGAENHDLSNSHPYPVPYKPSEIPDTFIGTIRSGITFTDLPSECSIDIYTISGRLVNTLTHSDADLQINGQVGNYYWYPIVNKYDEEVASGVYLYNIISANSTKQGKIMIIR